MADLLGTGVGVLDVGAGGIVVAVIFMLLTGRLVTKTAHDETVADRDRQITDWRDAYKASDARGDHLERLLDQLVEQGRTTTHLLSTLRQVAAEPTAADDTGEPDGP